MNDYSWLSHLGYGLLFSIPGLLFSVVGSLVLRNSWLEARTWTSTDGTVIGYKEVQQGRHYDAQGKPDPRRTGHDDFAPGKWTFYIPQVQFVSADGKTITFASSIGSNKKSYQVGAAVKVLYSQDDPEKAVIKSFSNLWLVAIATMAMGLFFFGLALRPFFFK